MTDDAEPDAVYSCIDRGIQPGGLKRKRKGCGKAAKDKKKGSRGQQKGNN
jgi:hypothetical protein